MLSIEVIAVLVVVYGLLVYGLVRGRLAVRQAEQQAERDAPTAAEQTR